MAVKPIACWRDYAANQMVAMCDDGQVYMLPVLENGLVLGTKWYPFGPPLPGSQRAKDLQLTESIK